MTEMFFSLTVTPHVSRIYSNVTTQRGLLLLLAKQLPHPTSLTPLPTDPHFLYPYMLQFQAEYFLDIIQLNIIPKGPGQSWN